MLAGTIVRGEFFFHFLLRLPFFSFLSGIRAIMQFDVEAERKQIKSCEIFFFFSETDGSAD